MSNIIEITGRSGKSIIVSKLLTKRSMLVCTDPSAMLVFANAPCEIWVSGKITCYTDIIAHIQDNPEKYDYVVIYTNEQIAMFRDQFAECVTDAQIVLIGL